MNVKSTISATKMQLVLMKSPAIHAIVIMDTKVMDFFVPTLTNAKQLAYAAMMKLVFASTQKDPIHAIVNKGFN